MLNQLAKEFKAETGLFHISSVTQAALIAMSFAYANTISPAYKNLLSFLWAGEIIFAYANDTNDKNKKKYLKVKERYL